jgi:ATP synthase protein I
MPDAPGERSDDQSSDGRKGEADAWSAFSLVLSGMLLWGGVGWFLSRWLDSQVPLALGLMGGTAGGLVLVWLRYGRSV